MDKILIKKTDRNLKGAIVLPASKSISNRALLIRELFGEWFEIENLSTAQDTVILNNILTFLRNNKTSGLIKINVDNAGTAMRFLTAYLAIKKGEYLLDGSERMRERPVGHLVLALRQLGASISFLEKENFPPLLIKGKNLKGGIVKINAGISSQFITALMLIAPLLPGGMKIRLEGKPSSAPYISMTAKMMNYFGIDVLIKKNEILINESKYQKKNISVEPDWSSASYWYEMAAFAEEVDLTIKGLKPKSLQGDVVVSRIFRDLGVETVFDNYGAKLAKGIKVKKSFVYDFSDCPDLAQTIMATHAGLGISAKLTGLKSLRIKETDRISAMLTELRKMKINVKSDSDIMELSHRDISKYHRTSDGKIISINTRNDHRMALSFAPLAMVFGEIIIENPDVVNKSYPGFWKDLKMLGFEISYLLSS